MRVNKKMLKWTILLIAMVQMPTLAVGPALSSMKAAFTNVDITTLQTALQSPNLISPFVSLAVIFLTAKIKKGSPQKTIIISGLSMLIVSAVGMIFFHNEFWTIYLWGACIGLALGMFIPTTNSLLYDCFNDQERREITGLQTTFINGGGIIMSMLGGFLANIGWYGGYLAFFLAIPVIVLSIRYIPGWKELRVHKKADNGEKMNFDINILYYAAIIFVFMSIYNVASTNMSILIIDELGIGTTAATGIISAVQLAGGTAAGLIFGKLSQRLKDNILVLGFIVLAAAFVVFSNTGSLIIIIIASFFAGSAMSMVMPQCSYAISLYSNERSSTIASAFSWSFAPSLGGFLSARIFTSSSLAIANNIQAGRFKWGFFCFKGTEYIAETMEKTGDAVSFRYGYVAFMALICAAILFILARLRKESKVNFA